jgi:hypothetical protein
MARILSGPVAKAVQPPCQGVTPDFIGFYDSGASHAEKLAGLRRLHPAI